MSDTTSAFFLSILYSLKEREKKQKFLLFSNHNENVLKAAAQSFQEFKSLTCMNSLIVIITCTDWSLSNSILAAVLHSVKLGLWA